MSMLTSVLAALLAAVYVDVPKTDVQSVRFPSPTLTLTRSKNGTSASIHGPCHVDIGISGAKARKPLLRIVCLCEADGELQWMDGLWDKPRTNARLSRSEIAAAFKTAGRDSACTEASCISSVMAEATTEAYASAVYGEADVQKGFFRLNRVSERTRLLLYRLEVWQNGVLAGAWESSRTGLGKYGIPKDWFVRGRYQQMFNYVKTL